MKEEPLDSDDDDVRIIDDHEKMTFEEVELPLGQIDIHSDTSMERQWNTTCQECGKTYSSNNNLKQHMINIHSPVITNYPCDICGRGFKSKQYLATHKVRCHGIRRTICIRTKPVRKSKPETGEWDMLDSLILKFLQEWTGKLYVGGGQPLLKTIFLCTKP